MLFSACSKSVQPENVFSPNGKTYAAYAYKSVISNEPVYWVYRFTSQSQAEHTAREGSPKGGIIGNPEIYTYSLNYPTMTMKNNSGVTLFPFTFINENTFRMTDSRGIVTEYNIQP